MGMKSTWEIMNDFFHSYNIESTYNSSGEIIVGDEYIPLLATTDNNTKITSLLPQEGEEMPFYVEDDKIFLAEEYKGNLVKIEQKNSTYNKHAIRSFVGNSRRLGERLSNIIIDGGHTSISATGDIDISAGLACIKGSIIGFAGLTLSIKNQVANLPLQKGFSLAVFIDVNHLSWKDGMLIPSIKTTEMISSQLGDYSTLYGVIKFENSVDFADLTYIELVRAQIISQAPGPPYIKTYIDQRMRKPSIECYPS